MYLTYRFVHVCTVACIVFNALNMIQYVSPCIILEIHAEHSRQKGQRQENSGHQRENHLPVDQVHNCSFYNNTPHCLRLNSTRLRTFVRFCLVEVMLARSRGRVSE